jgi:hypothetical protein
MPEPKTHNAKPSAADVLARLDVIASAIGVLAGMNKDRFLTGYASAHGAAAATDAARALGLDDRAWQAERADRERWTTQTSRTTLRYGPWDADEDPEVIRLLQTPGTSMDAINAARQQVIARHEAAGGNRQVGPGTYPRETPQPQPQRSLRSTNPDAQFRADSDPVPTPAQPVSKPPMQAADPSRS